MLWLFDLFFTTFLDSTHLTTYSVRVNIIWRTPYVSKGVEIVTSASFHILELIVVCEITWQLSGMTIKERLYYATLLIYQLQLLLRRYRYVLLVYFLFISWESEIALVDLIIFSPNYRDWWLQLWKMLIINPYPLFPQRYYLCLNVLYLSLLTFKGTILSILTIFFMTSF